MRLATGSWSWILPPFISGSILLAISLLFSNIFRSVLFFLCVVSFLLFGVLLIFFRDPDRQIGQGVVAVADGVIREVEKRVDHDVGDCLYISTFMNIHNVHVNRAPVDGTVIARKHQSGTHLPAFTKESKRNEHLTLLLETSHGPMKIVLIAGTLARRIVAYVDVDAVVSKGDRISMIRLGSRVDIYLPVNDTITCTVTKGQWVKAGVDSLAEIND